MQPRWWREYGTQREVIDEKMCSRNIGIKMANLLSFTNRENINATLNTIFHGIPNDDPNREILNNRWDSLEQVISPNSVLLQLVQ